MRIALWLATALAVAAPQALRAQTGNRAPSGPHYNLNIIGVSNSRNPNQDGGGNVIFVGLGDDGITVTTKIFLNQSADTAFAVLDKNGTDGQASFELPAPGSYTVWARALATPGGRSSMATCATEVDSTGTATLVCSTENEIFVRGTGKSSFRNVTSALTTIQLAAGSAAAVACGSTSVGLFDPCLEGYLWNYNNNGLKLLQLRFYPNPS
jgi:hypothetical protein